MSDFSIEMNAEKIVDHRTRRYFDEVLSSYTNGNYRSALVMLWSVAVCDLLYKLEQLSTAHNDKTAKEILASVTKMQKSKPTSGEWENKLLEEVFTKTHLLEPSEHLHLQTLQKDRHLSAHPVLTRNYELHSPTKKTVRAHLRSALEGLLTKPPIMTRRIFDSFMQDLASTGPILLKDDELKRYLQAKYFPSFIPSVEDSVFRSLWKLVFRATDAPCEQNRDTNLRALRILYERRKQEVSATISKDPVYFSDINPSGSPIQALFEFLWAYPTVFGLLNDAAKTILRGHADRNFNTYVISIFLSSDLVSHVESIKRKLEASSGDIQSVAFANLISAASSSNQTEQVLDLAAFSYSRSGSFSSADERFHNLVLPYLEQFTKANLLSILDGIEGNNQTYNRSRAARDHRKLKARCDAVFGQGFDYSQYPKFIDSVDEPPVEF